MTSLLLVGDIGGTHARFALYQGGTDGNGELHRHRTLSAVDHRAFDEAIRAYLSGVGVQSSDLLGGGFAVAAPLLGGVVQFTNSPWSFAQHELQVSLQLSRLTLLNDFEALAVRVPAMTSDETFTLRAGHHESRSARLVLGPGTGLGVGLLVKRGGPDWQVLPTEGSHGDFSPVDSLEDAILAHFRRRFGRVSAERVISGPGLADIHAALAALKQLDPAAFVDEKFGLPTVRDILAELEKPGRDPRKQFEAFSFSDEAMKIEDLKPGMKLPGIVTNVAAFGAFIDVGVHQDGLAHISQLSDQFVKNPSDVVKVGQKVNATVMEVDFERKRISLSLKTNPELGAQSRGPRDSGGGSRNFQPRPQQKQAPQVDWFTAAMNKKN